MLCATTLAVLLVIGGVEKNPGPGVEAEKILQVLCSWSDRKQRVGNGTVISVDRRDSGG